MSFPGMVILSEDDALVIHAALAHTKGDAIVAGRFEEASRLRDAERRLMDAPSNLPPGWINKSLDSGTRSG